MKTTDEATHDEMAWATAVAYDLYTTYHNNEAIMVQILANYILAEKKRKAQEASQ